MWGDVIDLAGRAQLTQLSAIRAERMGGKVHLAQPLPAFRLVEGCALSGDSGELCLRLALIACGPLGLGMLTA